MSGASWEVGESAHVERCHVPGRSGDVSQEKEQRCVPGTAWVCVTGRRSEGNVSQVKARVVCQMKRWGGYLRPREWGQRYVPGGVSQAEGVGTCPQQQAQCRWKGGLWAGSGFPGKGQLQLSSSRPDPGVSRNWLQGATVVWPTLAVLIALGK